MQSTYDVAIAGGGAAGHALAAMLAGRGLSLLHVHSGTPGDARPIALSWGSRQLLGGLGAWPQVAALGFDERFRRLWRFYLAYCEAGFRSGATDVYQFLLEKPRT